MAQIVSSNEMTKDLAGSINTAFFLTYGSGQLINGILGDILSPFVMVGSGVLISGIMNLLMYAAVSTHAGLTAYLVVWAVNGFVQSMVWSPLLRIISTIMPEEQRSRACANLQMSTAVGTLGTSLLATILLKYLPWKDMFLFPGITLVITGVSWFLLTRKIVRETQYTVVREKSQHENYKASSPQMAFFPMIIASGVLLMLLPAGVSAMVKDGVTSWGPTIITEMFSVSPSTAVLLSAIVPLGNIVGAYMVHFVLRYLIPNELTAAAAFFAGSTVFMLLFFMLGRTNLVLMLLCIAGASLCMMAIGNLFVSFVPMRFGKYGKASTVTGILNAVCNLFCSLSSLVIGFVTVRTGNWNLMILIWIGLCVIGLVSSVMIIRRWKRFIKL